MAERARGDVLEVLIERVVPGGAGLGRIGGVVALAAGGLPGDRVRMRVVDASPRLVRGTVEEILSPGDARRPEPDVCPRARDGTCGGCDWPAARLDHHRALKTALVLDALRRLGGFSEEELPPPGWHGSARNYRLRNRLHLDADGRLGFFAPRSNVVSNLEVCELVSTALLARLPAMRVHLADLGARGGELVTLEDREGKLLLGELRLGAGEDRKTSARVRERGRGPFDGLRVVDASGRVLLSDGPDSLAVVAGGASFEVGVSSFFQGNRFLLDDFLEEVRTALRAALRKGERGAPRPCHWLDLYAGVGFLTRPLLELAAETFGVEVTAVEVDPSASFFLSKNVSLWSSLGLPLARAVRASAESFLRPQTSPIDILVADPPRAGISPEVREGILRLGPSSLLMVSCDPPTLARDLAALKPFYAIERLTLLDLFPQTHHVETVVLLSRRKNG